MTPDEAQAIAERIYAKHIDRGGMREAIAAALLEAAGDSTRQDRYSQRVSEFSAWAERMQSLHEQPCQSHADNKHQWLARIGGLTGHVIYGCECGAVRPSTDQS